VDVVTAPKSVRRDLDVELMKQSVVLEAQCVHKVCVCFLDVLIDTLTRISAPSAVI
jgi:hypothetical protein